MGRTGYISLSDDGAKRLLVCSNPPGDILDDTLHRPAGFPCDGRALLRRIGEIDPYVSRSGLRLRMRIVSFRRLPGEIGQPAQETLPSFRRRRCTPVRYMCSHIHRAVIAATKQVLHMQKISYLFSVPVRIDDGTADH